MQVPDRLSPGTDHSAIASMAKENRPADESRPNRTGDCLDVAAVSTVASIHHRTRNGHADGSRLSWYEQRMAILGNAYALGELFDRSGNADWLDGEFTACDR